VVATRVGGRRRLAACLSLVALATEVVVVVVGLHGQLARLVAAVVLLLAATIGGWFGITRRGLLRRLGVVVAAVAAALFALVVLTGDAHGLTLLIVVALGLCSVGLTRYALRRDRRSIRNLQVPGTPVGPARHGVLIINPKSGGGKATRFALADEARRRGIEPVVLEPGSDLRQLAEGAADSGADVIGMAGGDGSQAVVASVAMRHDIAFVCIPAGTRNHFALDLGLERGDLVGALDAFGDAFERRIDLSEVGGHVFVNNVSLGIYAKIVQSPEYRDAKRETIESLLPDLLGPNAQPYHMQFTDPSGKVHDRAQLIQISNNPYQLTRIAGFGTRARLDTATLGVSAIELRGATDLTRLLAAEAAGQVHRLRGYTEFTSSTLTVESDRRIEAAIDGEAALLDPPLEFRSLPGVLRVRIPANAPGYSPAALVPPSKWWTLSALFRTVVGVATPIDETQR
jgi:diacylglycerol kinase family enzyme